MRIFLRESTVGREPLAVSMSSVRPGECVLQIGVNDPHIVHAIANKVGVTGRATIVVPNESSSDHVRSVGGEGASSADVRIEPLDHLPFEDGAYDVVVIHNVDGLLASLDAVTRGPAMRECCRVLRPGGRVIVLDRGQASGMRAIFRAGPKRDPRYVGSGDTAAALQAGGFVAVRVLADREGYRFIEGVRPR